MTTIDKTAAAQFDALGLTREADSKDKSNNDLGQQDFLELMLAQLRNQDPLKPLENGDFLGQMAQFSTVNGIEDLNNSFAEFANSLQTNRALQASSLVGRSVLVPTTSARLDEGGSVRGAAELPAPASSVSVTVSDVSGQTIRTFDLGAQTGVARFTWDGLDNAGQAVPPGEYQIRVDANIDGDQVTLDSLVESKVESVSLGQGSEDIILNVAGRGPVPLREVNEIL